MPGPLHGIKVLDLSRVLAGPYCSMLLADLGADVAKVEIPGKGDDTRAWGPPFLKGESVYFLSCNRNKRSITIDMKKPRGLELVRELAKTADVLLENFRPGTMDRLGLTWESLSNANPRLVFASISGFGSTGPYADRPGYDLIAQGMGGFMSFTGEEGGGPLKVGLPVADINAGMFCTMGILAALYERERSGKGQRLETSLLEGQVAQLVYQAQRFFATGTSPGPEGNVHPLIAPYATFPAKDGHINLAVGNDSLFKTFCNALGLDDLPGDDKYKTNALRVANRAELTAKINAVLARYTVEQLQKIMDDAGVPNGPILPLEKVLSDPQVLAREMVVELEHPKVGTIKQTGVPIKLERTPGQVKTPPPGLGDHRREILVDWLRMGDEAIDKLISEKVI
jgi:crotonobetainyl-CoA:carnitine CoA-transferase CaiB-like acyl-CoA transferase